MTTKLTKCGVLIIFHRISVTDQSDVTPPWPGQVASLTGPWPELGLDLAQELRFLHTATFGCFTSQPRVGSAPLYSVLGHRLCRHQHGLAGAGTVPPQGPGGVDEQVP